MKRATKEWLRRHAAGGHWQTSDSEAARDALDSNTRQAAELRRLRAFARFIKAQLGTGPRTNGISQEFCFDIGERAKAALKPARRKP